MIPIPGFIVLALCDELFIKIFKNNINTKVPTTMYVSLEVCLGSFCICSFEICDDYLNSLAFSFFVIPTLHIHQQSVQFEGRISNTNTENLDWADRLNAGLP
jgi:hypothetical protein